MRKAIIYATKSGTTEKCAKMIEDKLDDNVSLINLKEANVDVDKYDILILGSAVRFGSLQQEMKNFLMENFEKILTKKVVVYMCCGFEEKKKEYWLNSIPVELKQLDPYIEALGGEINMNKMNILEKLVINLISLKSPEVMELSLKNENIDSLVTRIKLIEEENV